MVKTINLTLEDTEIELKQDSNSLLIEIWIGSTQILPSIEETKEIIKALQQILPEDGN